MMNMIDLKKLWYEIDVLHLSYLRADESPRKLQEKIKLEERIKQYLSSCPVSKKFIFNETKLILHTTIDVNNDFSPSKACSAWSAIAAYAHNLLSQPWRKEFEKIQKFSGFYKHNIEEVLVGGEMMLELMGYQNGGDVLTLNRDLVDNDEIISVSKDCIIAAVECKIMLTIYTGVVQTVRECTWMDILMHRENYSTSPEVAIQTISYTISQRQHELYATQHRMNNYASVYSSSGYINPSYNSQYPPPYHLLNNGHSQHYGNSSQIVPSNYSVHNTYYNKIPHNSYSSPLYNHYYDPSNIPQTSNPQLITHWPPNHNGHDYDKASGHAYNVPNFLTEQDLTHHARSTTPLNFYDEIDTYSIDKKHLKNPYITPKVNQDPYNELFRSPKNRKNNIDYLTDDLDLNNRNTSFPSSTSSVKRNSNSTSRLFSDYSVPKPKNESLDNPGPSTSQSKLTGDLLDKRIYWNCRACTFLNQKNKDICEICGKSKEKGNENVPLVSGGRHCPKCTYINKRDAILCEVCHENLKDSPTYI